MRAERQWRTMPKRRLCCLAVLILSATSVLGGCRATIPITVRIVTPTEVATPSSTMAPALAEPTSSLPTPGSRSVQ